MRTHTYLSYFESWCERVKFSIYCLSIGNCCLIPLVKKDDEDDDDDDDFVSLVDRGP